MEDLRFLFIKFRLVISYLEKMTSCRCTRDSLIWIKLVEAFNHFLNVIEHCDFSVVGQVKITMFDYIQEMIDEHSPD